MILCKITLTDLENSIQNTCSKKQYIFIFFEHTRIHKNQGKYIDLARQEAKKSILNHKHGCIIVNKGKIIGIGYNKHHPVNNSYHAEAIAIHNAKVSNNNLRGSVMYIVRVTGKKEGLANSKPCSKCAKMITKYRINCIYCS